jgi:predicted amidophosphoribosyltransferase
MATLVFFLMAAVAAAAIAYPLLPRALASQTVPMVTDGDIEEAVRSLRQRRAKSKGGPSCPACGRVYQAGDRFCAGCGGELPATGIAAATCPSCGAALREGDQFCSKCGHLLTSEEVA